MKIAIMQPYFFPYIGYFQLINSVDKFVVYDDIEYTKKGWINRNRFLMNGCDFLFSIPLKKDSDLLNVNKRFLADNYPDHKKKVLGQISSSYAKSPQFKTIFPIIEECLNFENYNLFFFIHNSLNKICNYLDIKTEFIISSTLAINPDLKGENKVLEINKKLNSNIYINAIGGQELYSREKFLNNNIELKFIKTNPIIYTQFNNEFIPFLSIIDVMMFNSKEEIKKHLDSYTFV
ncbi:MAG: WbqC family protein [Bacteroidetes bacterium]|nr:WbqC family protein [Bacteroidota bacterium]